MVHLDPGMYLFFVMANPMLGALERENMTKSIDENKIGHTKQPFLPGRVEGVFTSVFKAQR